MEEMRVQSLAWEDPLEQEMATHSSIPAWRIPWTEEPGRLQSLGSQKSWTRLKRLSTIAVYMGILSILNSHWEEIF